MKSIFERVLSILIITLLVLAVIGCKERTNEEFVKVYRDEAKIIRGVAKSEDYLDKDVVLAAFLWEETFSEATFFPARIIEKPSDPSTGEYHVEALAGSRLIEIGKKHRTKNVILKSHPPKRKELKTGMVVLFCGEDRAFNESELKNEKWYRGVILNTDELDNYVVEIGYYKKLNKDVVKTYKVHIRNLRVIDDPVIEGPEL